MRPSSFDFTRPTSLAEAASQARAGAVLLGGGQALIQSLRLRTAQPANIVDLKHVADLSGAIVLVDGAIRIGALVTVAQLLDAPLIAERLPMLREAAGRLGDVQVRNRATVVGNVCWADPRANLALALTAYEAILTISDGRAERRLPIVNVFTGFRAVSLTPGEIVTSIDVPVCQPAEPAAYLEFSRQRNDLALVNIAVVRKSSSQTIVAAGGLAQMPVRLAAVERLLLQQSVVPSLETLKVAMAQTALSSLGDPFGSLDYKIHVGAVLLLRILNTLNNKVHHAGR